MSTSEPLLKADRGIIIAADVPALDDLSRLSELGSRVRGVVAIKIGFSLALRYGLQRLVDTVSSSSELPVIYDHQKAGTDIPAMGKPFAEVCHGAGVKGAIIFPQAGPKTLEAFASALFEKGLTPIVGLVMTHEAYLQAEGGFICDSAPDSICSTSIDLGVKTFVLPGTKTAVVKRYAEGLLAPVKPVSIMMPGIGSQGGSIEAVVQATKGHHPFPIIGSAIYRADDPRSALEQFASEILT